MRSTGLSAIQMISSVAKKRLLQKKEFKGLQKLLLKFNHLSQLQLQILGKNNNIKITS